MAGAVDVGCDDLHRTVIVLLLTPFGTPQRDTVIELLHTVPIPEGVE